MTREERIERSGHDWWKTGTKDTGTDPPRYLWRCDACHLDRWSSDLPDALDPDHPCAKGVQPVEITDEMVERAWKAGQDDLPVGQRWDRRWDKPALYAALRAALEGKEQAVAQHTRGCIAGDIDAECPCEHS